MTALSEGEAGGEKSGGGGPERNSPTAGGEAGER